MDVHHANRRKFIKLSLLAATGTLFSGSVFGEKTFSRSFRHHHNHHHAPVYVIYRLSLRGRRGSRAAKLHNANMRFATRHHANQNRAHPGDNSRIVPLIISRDEYFRLFVPQKGLRNRFIAVSDLRKL